jgi:hypothetical protein
MTMDPELFEKAKLVQQGLQQFDRLHQPRMANESEVKVFPDFKEKFICGGCSEVQKIVVDYPCQRMLYFMLLQGVATLNAAIPSGNVASVMQKFMGGAR